MHSPRKVPTLRGKLHPHCLHLEGESYGETPGFAQFWGKWHKIFPPSAASSGCQTTESCLLCLCVCKSPQGRSGLDGQKSCGFIITIITVVFVTITVIMSGSGMSSSAHLGSQEVGEGSREWIQDRFAGAQTLCLVHLSRKGLTGVVNCLISPSLWPPGVLR